MCAASFSHDNAYVVAVGCDDKHNMGVWSLFSGELQASFPTAPGIPPQIRALSFSPMGMQVSLSLSLNFESKSKI